MRFIQTQTSFRSGKLSRKLDGRIDIDEYSSGCRELENMLVMKTGGVKKPPGDSFIEEVLNDHSYLKEEIYIFSDGKERLFRFYSTSVSAPYSITLDVFDQTISGDFGTLLVSIATGFTLPDILSELSITQYEDTIWCATSEGTQYIRGFTWNGTTIVLDSTFSSMSNVYNWPLQFENDIEVQLTGARNTVLGGKLARDAVITSRSGGIQVWSTYVGVGELVAIVGKTRTGGTAPFIIATQYYTVTSLLGSGAVLEPYFQDPELPGFDLMENNVFGEVYFQAWGSKHGHPKVLSSDDGRLIAAAPPDKPSTIYASLVNDARHFNNVRQQADTLSRVTYFGPLLNTDPYIFTLASDRTANIKFIDSNRELIIGTDERVYVGTGGDGIIGPLNIQIRPFNSSPVSSVFTKIDDGVLYLSLDKSKLIQFHYNTDNGTFVSRELSVLSDEIYADRAIDQIIYHEKERVVFMKRRFDGFLLTTKVNVLTLSPDTGIIAHASFDIPKPLQSMAYSTLTGDMYNSYTYDGRSVFTRWNIEGEFLSNERYLRLAQQITPGGPQTLWTYDAGEDGDEVCYVDNDGNTGYATLDASKQFTTPELVASLTVGFCYNSKVCPMPIEAGQQWGSAQMGVKRVDTVSTRFLNSFSFKISELNSGFKEEQILAVTTPSGVQPFTGPFETKLSSTPSREQVICVENDRPEAFVVLIMSFRGVSNDG